ncbi:Potassium channel [Apophysomyces sp. BC1015]|nr:Potassium channel [Apophysomyces sp. BC1015]
MYTADTLEDDPQDRQRTSIQFAFPKRPVYHRQTYSSESREEETVSCLGEWLEEGYTWWDEWREALHWKHRTFSKSSKIAELPFFIATFCTIYATFILVRALGTLCLAATYNFSRRSASLADYVYSRGYWSCLLSGSLEFLAAFGFTADCALLFPYSDLSFVLKGVVLPSIMACTMIASGALIFMRLENWTHSEAVVFCSTALTTIGYGDLVPVTKTGRVFFLIYTIVGIGVIGYFLLSIRAVITGNSSNMMKVNLMRVESLHDYSHRQQQKWSAHHETSVGPPPSLARPRREYRRTYSNVSSFSNYTITNILNEKDRQILVQVITRSGTLRMSVILMLSWFGGATVFCWLEKDWTYLDALYFTFATQLTIGFGDLVPQTALAQEFWLLYIILSITVAAYFISLFGDVLVEKLQIQDDYELTSEDDIGETNSEIPGYVTLARGLEDDQEHEPASDVQTGQSPKRYSLPPEHALNMPRHGLLDRVSSALHYRPGSRATSMPVTNATLREPLLSRLHGPPSTYGSPDYNASPRRFHADCSATTTLDSSNDKNEEQKVCSLTPLVNVNSMRVSKDNHLKTIQTISPSTTSSTKYCSSNDGINANRSQNRKMRISKYFPLAITSRRWKKPQQPSS